MMLLDPLYAYFIYHQMPSISVHAKLFTALDSLFNDLMNQVLILIQKSFNVKAIITTFISFGFLLGTKTRRDSDR